MTYLVGLIYEDEIMHTTCFAHGKPRGIDVLKCFGFGLSFCLCLFCFETKSYYVSQAGLKLVIFLP